MILAIIPARAGSKTIKNKNVYPLAGKPLIEYTLNILPNIRIDDAVLTTDCMECIRISDKYMPNIIKPINRPKRLCGDDVPMMPVIKHAVEEYEDEYDTCVDTVLLLQPTSPLRSALDVNHSIMCYCDAKRDMRMIKSLYTGYRIGIKHKGKVYDKYEEPPHFQRNGAIFITDRSLIDKGKLWDDLAIEVEMPKCRSIDIDDRDDMFIAESLIKNGAITWL